MNPEHWVALAIVLWIILNAAILPAIWTTRTLAERWRYRRTVRRRLRDWRRA